MSAERSRELDRIEEEAAQEALRYQASSDALDEARIRLSRMMDDDRMAFGAGSEVLSMLLAASDERQGEVLGALSALEEQHEETLDDLRRRRTALESSRAESGDVGDAPSGADSYAWGGGFCED